jgi:hypothetical protein
VAWHSNANLCSEHKSDWFYIHWDSDFPEASSKHINIKELYIVKLSLDRWAPLCRDKNVVLYTDNNSTKFWINKGSSTSLDATNILCDIHYLCAEFNIYLTAKYVASEKNITADALSRFHDLNMATTAHSMLEQFCDIDIAADYFEVFNHMSYYAFIAVLQSWENSLKCCNKNCTLTKNTCLQSQQR